MAVQCSQDDYFLGNLPGGRDSPWQKLEACSRPRGEEQDAIKCDDVTFEDIFEDDLSWSSTNNYSLSLGPTPHYYFFGDHQFGETDVCDIESVPRGLTGIEDTNNLRITPLQKSSTRSSSAAPKYTCNECHEEFSTSTALEDHALDWRHRSYACPEFGCSKTFTRRDSCQRHKTSHKPVGDHKCEKCGKTFARKDHQTTHTKKCQSTSTRGARTISRKSSMAALSSGVSKLSRTKPLQLTSICQPSSIEDPRCSSEAGSRSNQSYHVKSLVESLRAGLGSSPKSSQLLSRLEAQTGHLEPRKAEQLFKQIAELAVEQTAPGPELGL